MKELIYKQDAIDAISDIVSTLSVCMNISEWRGMRRMQDRAIKELENLEPVKAVNFADSSKSSTLNDTLGNV